MSRRVPLRIAGAAIAIVLMISACSGDDDDGADPVATAQRRVEKAEQDVADAEQAFDAASAEFCADTEDYVAALDRYGSFFTDGQATVGDVQDAGDDLVEPREEVTSTVDDVLAARDSVTGAQQALVDARADLAAVQGVVTVATSDAPTTTVPLVPTATVDRVQQAEADLDDAFEGVTAQTPIVEAAATVNAAAFALQAAWLHLFADAGCLTDDQQSSAESAVNAYTRSLQNALQRAGYYEGEIDGIYGPDTIAAVKQLQTDAGLPVTGFADIATSEALENKLAELGGDADAYALAYTVAVQTGLKLAGYWDQPIGGTWTDDLTAAVEQLQTDLGVPVTGTVDALTLAALYQAIDDAKAAASTTTTTPEAPPSSDAAEPTTVP